MYNNKLFTSDKFSNNEIKYKKQVEPEETIIKAAEKLLDRSRDAITIYSINEIGINSQNWLVSVKDKKYIIKRIKSITEKQLLKRKIELSEKLRKDGIPFPKIYLFRENYWVEIDGENWILMEYIKGNYFNGSPEEMIQICKLQKELNERCIDYQKNELIIIETIEYKRSDMSKSLISLKLQKTRIADQTKIDYELVSQVVNLMETNIKYMDAEIPKDQLGYIDMHPHNLLIHNNELNGLLDVDALKLTNRNIATAFNIFKLFRQLMVHEKLNEDTKNLKHIINEYLKKSNYTENEDYFLRSAAVEIMRRILYITDSIITSGTSEWSPVLEIQLKLIIEINVITKKLHD